MEREILEKDESGDVYISEKWYVEDIKYVASDLTDAECEEVLIKLATKHDCEIGINWGVIEFWCDEIRSRRFENGNNHNDGD